MAGAGVVGMVAGPSVWVPCFFLLVQSSSTLHAFVLDRTNSFRTYERPDPRRKLRGFVRSVLGSEAADEVLHKTDQQAHTQGEHHQGNDGVKNTPGGWFLEYGG